MITISVKYITSTGELINCSGLTPGGTVEAGAVAQKSVTVEIPITASGAGGEIAVSFSEDMPDNNYLVNYDCSTAVFNFRSLAKTKSGFTLGYANISDIATTSVATVKITAIKTYTVQHDIQNTEAISAIQAAMPSGAGSANKLVTTSQVNNALDGLDDRIDNIEDLVPTSASVSNQLATKADVALDATPTASSHKGVESGGVYEALNDKDVTPTKNSTKSVTSGGIYNSENEIWKANGISGAKNYCKSLPTEAGLTKGGVTMVRNDDGSFTFSGTCDSETGFTLGETLERYDWAGYILSGCPVGGGASTFYLRRRITNSSGQFIRHDCDYGEGVVLTALEDGEYGTISMVIKNGQNMDGIIMRPMVRSPKDTDDTYVPFAMTNRQLTPIEKACTFESGWASENVYPIEQGAIVFWQPRFYYNNNVVAGTKYKICTLPEGFAPTKADVYQACFNVSGTYEGSLEILRTRVVNFTPAINTTRYFCYATNIHWSTI